MNESSRTLHESLENHEVHEGVTTDETHVHTPISSGTNNMLGLMLAMSMFRGRRF